MRVLVLSRYGPMGASSRLRLFQYLPLLGADGIDFVVSPLIANPALRRKYESGSYGVMTLVGSYARRMRTMLSVGKFDLVWIEKEALPWVPAAFESWLLSGVPYILDFDDAVFLNYERSSSVLIRRLFRGRIEALMAQARLVIVGNSYLADRAVQAGTERVEILPTVVDMSRYPSISRSDPQGTPRIVWIGSPSTAQYLTLLHAPLQELARSADFVFRVIGADRVDIRGVSVECVAWSEATEVERLSDCDIGVMPLFDSEWEQGKCAYKLIQYMACSLPTVASPVGANLDVTIEGQTGLFARTDSEWISSLATLIADSTMRRRLGAAGRERVVKSYSLEHAAQQLLSMFRSVGN